MVARLITIPFSHYCEKARWALERCGISYEESGSLPIFHYLANRRAGAGRTVPVVVDGATLLTDSTDIVAWADSKPPGTLLPEGPARAEALAIEDEVDRQLGPATRRWAYYYLLPRRDLHHLLLRGVPRWQASLLPFVRPLAVAAIGRSLKIDAAGVARSRQKIDAMFSKIGERLATGQRYLVGNRFSVADLTFAALVSPVLFPREHPFPMPALEQLPAEACEQIEAWRASPAGAFALRIYADHRSV